MDDPNCRDTVTTIRMGWISLLGAANAIQALMNIPESGLPGTCCRPTVLHR